jgi:Predicted RNA binding protein (contains ribosomal protein S1 domain)
MIGKIINITKFGIFIDFVEDGIRKRGLARWSDTPKGSTFHKFDFVDIEVLSVDDRGKINLAVKEIDFDQQYARFLEDATERLLDLEERNRDRQLF